MWFLKTMASDYIREILTAAENQLSFSRLLDDRQIYEEAEWGAWRKKTDANKNRDVYKY